MTRRRNRADNPEGGATGTVRPSYWLTGGYLVLVLVPAWLYVGYAVLTPARAEVREPVAITGAFDAEEAAYIHQAGDNAVHGQVLLRPRNGGLLACTGDEMLLVPRTQYAEERIGHLYGSAERAGANNGLKLGTADPGYKEHMRRSRCDARGNFSFEGIADGRYFVVGGVVRETSKGMAGPLLMRPVEVRGGQTLDVVMLIWR